MSADAALPDVVSRLEPPEKAPAKYRHQSLRFDPEEPPGDASEPDYYIDETD